MKRNRAAGHIERGAALITAMLVVTLVAVLAAGALWRNWRQVDIESAQRARQQMDWLLAGAMDWARLILREDARAGNVDDLAEPWAVPLQESRLSSFIAADQSDDRDRALEAYLSGQIIDQQSRLNVFNLMDGTQPSTTARQQFARLFTTLGLPQADLDSLSAALQSAVTAAGSGSATVLPVRVDQLAGLGLAPDTVTRLLPFVTLLPEHTPVNLNTAPAEVLAAAIPGLELADAQRLVSARSVTPFRALSDASPLLGRAAQGLNTADHAVGSRYFEIQARLRLDSYAVREHALVRRDGLDVRTLWRVRYVAPPAIAADSNTVQ